VLAFACLAVPEACADDPHATEPRGARDAGAKADPVGRAASTADAQADAPEREPDADAQAARPGTSIADGGALVPASGVGESLIDHRRWARVDTADDSFADGPATPYCGPSATMAETLADEPVFSVDTGFCDYLTVSQQTTRAVAAGETIKVRLWHFELSAPMPAQAHAAVVVDGLPVLDEHIAIPAVGGLLTRQLLATRAIAVGAPVLFHLHNHGANSWALVELSAAPE
jgi:hypothetical protein